MSAPYAPPRFSDRQRLGDAWALARLAAAERISFMRQDRMFLAEAKAEGRWARAADLRKRLIRNLADYLRHVREASLAEARMVELGVPFRRAA